MLAAAYSLQVTALQGFYIRCLTFCTAWQHAAVTRSKRLCFDESAQTTSQQWRSRSCMQAIGPQVVWLAHAHTAVRPLREQQRSAAFGAGHCLLSGACMCRAGVDSQYIEEASNYMTRAQQLATIGGPQLLSTFHITPSANAPFLVSASHTIKAQNQVQVC